jgi:transcriptional regulator with XRE-family HTH domain
MNLAALRRIVMQIDTAPATHAFKSVCRQWRQHRKLSQLDLALAADVSQRHVSWLETGRSQPSREMVIRLSQAMEIPLRERNVLLQSAGFSSVYRERGLADPDMAPVLEALNHVLKYHEPFPAVVIDRFWNVKKQNKAAQLLFSIGGDPEEMMAQAGSAGEYNLAVLSLHPAGLRQFIVNWEQIAPSFIRRLRSEARACGDAQLQEKFNQIIQLAGPVALNELPGEQLLPVLPLEIAIDGLELSLFSVITTFGTPQDITADELRIEAFYPANPTTESFFRAL